MQTRGKRITPKKKQPKTKMPKRRPSEDRDLRIESKPMMRDELKMRRMKKAGGSLKPKKSKPKFKDNPEDRFGKYRRHKA
jgi:hypothetical protein